MTSKLTTITFENCHLFTFPLSQHRDNQCENVVDVLMDEGQQGDTVGQLGQDELTHGDHPGDDQQRQQS